MARGHRVVETDAPRIGRKEIAKRMAKNTRQSQQTCRVFLIAAEQAIRDELLAADPEVSIHLPDLGHFEVFITPPTVYHGYFSKEAVHTPARRRARFRASMELIRKPLQRPIEDMGYEYDPDRPLRKR